MFRPDFDVCSPRQTLALILLQITFGAVIVYAPLTSLFGGEAQAKKWWKYHR